MATFAIPQADKLCMDYEARMHSLLKSTLQEERVMTGSIMHMLPLVLFSPRLPQERAAKHSEDSMVEQLSKERQLSYGLQEAAARNYRCELRQQLSPVFQPIPDICSHCTARSRERCQQYGSWTEGSYHVGMGSVSGFRIVHW